MISTGFIFSWTSTYIPWFVCLRTVFPSLYFSPLPPLWTLNKGAFFGPWLTHETCLCTLWDNASTLAPSTRITRPILSSPAVCGRCYLDKPRAIAMASRRRIRGHRYWGASSRWPQQVSLHLDKQGVISEEVELLLKNSYHVSIRDKKRESTGGRSSLTWKGCAKSAAISTPLFLFLLTQWTIWWDIHLFGIFKWTSLLNSLVISQLWWTFEL